MAKNIGNTFVRAVVAGAINNAITQGVSVAMGWQKEFSWAGVAAAGVSAGVISELGSGLPPLSGPDAQINAANMFAHGMVGGAAAVASAATRSLIEGSDFGDNVMAALPDVIGQTIGEAIAGRMNGGSLKSPAAAKVGKTPQTAKQVAADCQAATRLNFAKESDDPYRDPFYRNGEFHDPGTGQTTVTASEMERYNGRIVEGPLPELDVSVTMDPIVITAHRQNAERADNSQAMAIARGSLEAMREGRRQRQAQQHALEQQQWSRAHQAASARVTRELGGAAWQFARDWAPGISDVSGAVDFVNRPTVLGGAAVVVGVVPFAGDALAKALRHADEAGDLLRHASNAHLANIPPHPNPNRAYTRADEFLTDANIDRLHPTNDLQRFGGEELGRGGVRDLTNDELLMWGGRSGDDPITVARQYGPGDHRAYPASRIQIQAGHHRLEEVARRVQNGTLPPDTLIEVQRAEWWWD